MKTIPEEDLQQLANQWKKLAKDWQYDVDYWKNHKGADKLIAMAMQNTCEARVDVYKSCIRAVEDLISQKQYE